MGIQVDLRPPSTQNYHCARWDEEDGDWSVKDPAVPTPGSNSSTTCAFNELGTFSLVWLEDAWRIFLLCSNVDVLTYDGVKRAVTIKSLLRLDSFFLCLLVAAMVAVFILANYRDFQHRNMVVPEGLQVMTSDDADDSLPDVDDEQTKLMKALRMLAYIALGIPASYQDASTLMLANMRSYSARALGEEFRLTEGSDRDVLAQLQLMPWKTALLTFWMASNPVSRIFLYSKSSCRSRAVVFWLQVFTTSSVQFFLSDSASLTVGEGSSVDMCFPFSGFGAMVALYMITIFVDSICTNRVGNLYRFCGDSPPMRFLFLGILCGQVFFLYAFIANTDSEMWYLSIWSLMVIIFQRNVFWVVFEGFWLMVILRRAQRSLDRKEALHRSLSKTSIMAHVSDGRLVESNTSDNEPGKDGEWYQDVCGTWYHYKNG